MAMVIKPKRKFTAGAPGTDDLVEGEIAINTADKKLYVRDNASNIIEIGGAAGTTSEITQNSHGFVVKDAIYHTGSAWAKAQANSTSTLALGIVTEKTTNTFVVAQSGRFELSSHGLTVGQWYYLSAASAGGLVTAEPTISQPIVYVEDANNIFIFAYRPTNLLINGSSSIITGDNTVSTAKLVNDAVTVDKMAVNSVDSDQYVDGSIDTAHIANDQITNALMADDAVGVAQLSATGTPSATTFLCGNNTWTAVGGAYNDWEVKTSGSPFTASAKDQLLINSGSAYTVNLPAGSDGNSIIICNAGAGTVTISANGSEKINSSTDDGTLPQGNSVQLVYAGSTIGWFEI